MRTLGFVLVLAGLGSLTAGLTSSPQGQSAVRQSCSSRLAGEFDGDGRRDLAIVFSTRHKCNVINARSWYLVIRFGRGARLRHPLGHDLPAFNEGGQGCEFMCSVKAAPDFNRDGRDELEVSIQQGASTEQRAIYGVVAGHLRRLRAKPARSPLTFSYGGSVTHGADVLCRTRAGRHLVVAAAWGTWPSHTSVTENVYRFDGRTFIHVRDRTYNVRSSAGSPPPIPGSRC